MDSKHETPWGYWEVLLETPTYKVKRILVRPQHRTSLQKHSKRNETWVVVRGECHAIIGDEDHLLLPGHVQYVPIETVHRIANRAKEDLEMIEVQLGSYFGEDDIVRIEDDYNRV